MTRNPFALIPMLALILMLAVPAARAEAPRGPHQPPPAFAELARMLELTEAQRAPVRSLISAHRRKMHAIDASAQDQREDLQESHRQQLARLLSAEQLQRFDELAARHHAQGPQRRPAADAADRAERDRHGDRGRRGD